MNHANANETLNFVIVCGLFLIALSTVLAMAVIYAQTRTVQSEFVLIVSNIAAGMVGFLSREYKTTQSAPAVSTDNVETVNVTQNDAKKGAGDV